MKLREKKIIVTGGASGMGASAVKTFAQEGAQVISIDLNKGEDFNNVTFIKGDVSNETAINEAVNKGAKILGGRIDALFCIAGINNFSKIEDITPDEWDNIFNAKGVFLTNKAALPYMKENGGSIVNFGSQASFNPSDDGAHYCASKAAVAAFTRKAAWQWGKYGIRVNTFCLAAATPLYQKFLESMSEEDQNKTKAGISQVFPLGHLGDCDSEISPVLVFLASDESKYISGQVICVNGGSAMVR